jgi:hypothetical protein
MIPFFQGAASGAPAPGTVFATTLYTGNGSNRTITSGIDADLVWIKGRSGATDHALYDTVRGATLDLVSNATSAETTQSTGLTAFGATGFDLGTLAKVNTNAATYVAWSFARAARFFDVVTYTGNNASNRQISHNLGVAPGMVIVKARDGATNWIVGHRSIGWTKFLLLQTTGAESTGSSFFNNTAPTSSVFTVGSASDVNGLGGTYVAYLFAHDTASDGIVQCGSYTGNGSATGPTVTLGWQPQFLLIKRAVGGTGHWIMLDAARGFPTGPTTTQPYLVANTSAAESDWFAFTGSDYHAAEVSGTGFQITTPTATLNNNTDTYVFLAVRAP